MMTNRFDFAISTVLLFILCGCTRVLDVVTDNKDSSICKMTKTTLIKDDEYFYYDGRPFIEINEPFRIEDMADSLNNFVFEKYGNNGSYVSLKPTHYAIKIIFNNLNQIDAILKDSSLFFQQHPFNLKPVPFENSLNSRVRSNNAEAHWDYSDDIVEECEIALGNACPIVLKPLYLFWPVSRPFPEGMDCTVCYEAFVPGAYNPSRGEFDSELIQEWVNGYLHHDRMVYMLKFKVYDTCLNLYKPIGNFTVSYWSSGDLCLLTVPSSGQITIYDVPNSNSSLTLSFYTSDFAIREGLTSNVYALSTGPLSNYGSGGFCNINLPANFYLDVYQSARYYYTGNSDILNQITRINNSNSFFSIHACDFTHVNGYLGVFYPSNPHVEIYNPYSYPSNDVSSRVFGTVLHELWHATHYYMMTPSDYSSVHSFIKESFASYFGWYNVFNYYSSVILNHQGVNSICTQGRQSWTPTTTVNANYTPLFIDLFDDYNQAALVDDVSYIACDNIYDMVCQSFSFNDIVNELDTLVLGGYLTTIQRDTIYNNYQRFNN